jgi:hypothetical protein
MKNARITLWRNTRPSSDNSPNLSGQVELPCELIAELYQMMQSGQYETVGYNPEVAGFSLRAAAWISPSNDPNNKKPEVSGYLDSKSEMNAYASQRATTSAPAPAQPYGYAPVAQQPAVPAAQPMPMQPMPAPGGGWAIPPTAQPTQGAPAPAQWQVPVAPGVVPSQQPAPAPPQSPAQSGGNGQAWSGWG